MWLGFLLLVGVEGLLTCPDSGNTTLSPCQFLPPGTTWTSFVFSQNGCSSGCVRTTTQGGQIIPVVDAFSWTVSTTSMTYTSIASSGISGTLAQPYCLTPSAYPIPTAPSVWFTEFEGSRAGRTMAFPTRYGYGAGSGFSVVKDSASSCDWPVRDFYPLNNSASTLETWIMTCPVSLTWSYPADSCSELVGIWNGIEVDPDTNEFLNSVPVDMQITVNRMTVLSLRGADVEIRCGTKVNGQIPYEWKSRIGTQYGTGLAVITGLATMRTIQWSGCKVPVATLPPPLWGRSWTYTDWSVSSANQGGNQGSGCINSGLVSAAQYQNNRTLSSDFKIFWTVDEANNQIFIALQGQTLGWVGFGPSPKYQMEGSDVIIAACSSTNVNPLFYDGYVEVRGLGVPPAHDTELGGNDDAYLHCCRQVNGWTIVEYSRPLPAKQPAFDAAIPYGLTPVVFAMSSKSPLLTGIPEQHDLIHQVAYIEFRTLVPVSTCTGLSKVLRYCTTSPNIEVATVRGNVFIRGGEQTEVQARLVASSDGTLTHHGSTATDTGSLLHILVDTASRTITPSSATCPNIVPPPALCISFANQILPILQSYGADGHVAGTNGGLSFLGQPSSVYSRLLTDTPLAKCLNFTRYIVPNRTDESFLFYKLQSRVGGLPAGCGARMPYGTSLGVSPSDLATLEQWILQGAPQNCGCPLNFVDNIYPILQQQAQVGHGGAAASGGFSVSGTPLELYNRLLNAQPTLNCPGYSKYVVPGQKSQSFLFYKLSSAPLAAGCGARMPLGASLTQTQALAIDTWITEGARYSCAGQTTTVTTSALTTNANPTTISGTVSTPRTVPGPVTIAPGTTFQIPKDLTGPLLTASRISLEGSIILDLSALDLSTGQTIALFSSTPTSEPALSIIGTQGCETATWGSGGTVVITQTQCNFGLRVSLSGLLLASVLPSHFRVVGFLALFVTMASATCAGADILATLAPTTQSVNAVTTEGDIVVSDGTMASALDLHTFKGSLAVLATLIPSNGDGPSCTVSANTNPRLIRNLALKAHWASQAALTVSVTGFSGEYHIHADSLVYGAGDLNIWGNGPPKNPGYFWGSMDDWGDSDRLEVSCSGGVAVTLDVYYNTPVCPDAGCKYMDLRLGDGRCNLPNGSIARMNVTTCYQHGGIEGVLVPNGTSFPCWSWELPSWTLNTHIVRIEPIIEQSEHYHHGGLFQVSRSFQIAHGSTGTCTRNEDCGSDQTNHCIAGRCVFQGHECAMGGDAFSFVWAVGMPAFDWPIGAGLPLADSVDSKPKLAFSMQIHYDNPKNFQHILDTSGLRVYYAPKRAANSGFISTGSAIQNAFTNGIPAPGQTGFKAFPPGVVAFGFGKMESTKQANPTMANQLTIFAHWPHMHQIGARIWTDVFANVNNFWRHKGRLGSPSIPFDFSRQEVKLIEPPLQLSSTDSLLTTCQWDSSRKTLPTFFGEDSEAEMCISLLFVYPMPVGSAEIGCLQSSGTGFLEINNTIVVQPTPPQPCVYPC